MLKYAYPDGSQCSRALHTAHAVFRNDDGIPNARAASEPPTVFASPIPITPARVWMVGRYPRIAANVE